MGLDGGRSIGMPKSSSESSSKFSKSEFSDSEFAFGRVKSKGGMDMGDGGRDIDGDVGVEIQLWGWRCGSRGWRW